MNSSRIIRAMLAAVAAALCAAAPTAMAQQYPAKPIRLVVPFPPGGIADLYGRVVGAKMTQSWGQQVLVDNRPGAGGNIGAEIVAKSPGDGYTLLIGNIGTHAVNAALFSKLPFDPVRDFSPIALLLIADGLLVVHPSLPVKTTKELIALARAQPGELNFASAGAGTASHLAGELFKNMARVKIVHVPYKGNVPAITDLLSGQTSMLFATLATVLPQAQANRLRPIAVLGAVRSKAIPEIPTLSESGLKGFAVDNWVGFFAAAGTPPAVISKLNAEVLRVMMLPEVQQELPKRGLSFMPTTPQQFADFAKAEKEKWGELVRAVGAKAD
jgi:tripartite-type tricarboxylate transporter receptor subunit TctC